MHMHTRSSAERTRFVLRVWPSMRRFPDVNRLTDKHAIAMTYRLEGSDVGVPITDQENDTITTLANCSPDRTVFP